MKELAEEAMPKPCDKVPRALIHECLRELRFLGVALFLLASTAHAQQWMLEPAISVRGTYTDNANLAPGGSERSDVYTEIAPSIRLRGQTARLRLTAQYAPRLFYYTNGTSADRVYHSLSSFANLEVINNFFFIDANANVSQQFISPFGPRPGEQGSATPNRTETRTYGVSPYLRGVTRSGITYLARYNTQWTNTASGSVGDSRRSDWLGRIDSPVRRFGWGLDYNHNDVKSNDQPSSTLELARARLYYQATPELRLQARGGYETNDYGLTDSSGSIYGGGIDWRPGPRTVASGYWEHRFFGDSYSASLDHRTRLTAWHLGASRDVTTTPQQLLAPGTTDAATLLNAILTASIPDPVARQAAVDQLLRQAGIPRFLGTPTTLLVQQPFVSQSLNGSAALTGVRNVLVLSLFYSESEPVTAGGATVPPGFLFQRPIKQTGGTLSYTLRVSQVSSLNASASRIKSKEDAAASSVPAASSTQETYQLILTQTLAPKTTGFAGLRYVVFDSDGSAFRDYREHAVFVGLEHRFY